MKINSNKIKSLFLLSLFTPLQAKQGGSYAISLLGRYIEEPNDLPVYGVADNSQLAKKDILTQSQLSKRDQRKFIRSGEEIIITTDNQVIIGICTVGFGVHYQGEHALVTAGHCSGNVGNKVYLSREFEEIGSVAQINYGIMSNNDYTIIRLFSSADGRTNYFQFSPKIPVLIGGNLQPRKILGAVMDTRLQQEVCGYGGKSDRVLCGKIVEFDYGIVDSAGIELNGLVKVSIENQVNFRDGDDGAPVYVTLGEYSQDVGAVGHVIGVYDADPENKFFYYEPINVIQQQYELITGASAPITSIPNSVIYGGRKIFIFSLEGSSKTPWNKQCTVGFAVKNIVYAGNRNLSFRDGFVTVGHCAPQSTRRDTNFPVHASNKPVDLLGRVVRNNFEGHSQTIVQTTEHDYLDVMLNIKSRRGINIFTPQPLVKVVTPTGTTAFYTVIRSVVPSINTEVKAYGAESGYKSGIIIGFDVNKNIPNPQSPETTITITGLVKVVIRDGQGVFVNNMQNNGIGDDGGPVYLQDDLTQTVQAVGLLIYSEFDNDSQYNVFYYMPIDRALDKLEITLMTRDNQY